MMFDELKDMDAAIRVLENEVEIAKGCVAQAPLDVPMHQLLDAELKVLRYLKDCRGDDE